MAGSSMRAGGIHWAATLDAGDFTKGAQRVKVEATRLQRELKAIQSQFKDSPFAQRTLAARAVENDKMRAAEQIRFQRETAANMQNASAAMAAYEARASAVSIANVKQTMTFRELNHELKGIFGRGSGFKDFLELAAGGGAIVGINLMAQQLGGMGRALSEVSTAFGSTTKSMDEMMTKFVQSIPIIGGIHDAVKGVVDVIGGGDDGKAAAAARNRDRAAGRAPFGQRAADQMFDANERRSMVGLSGTDAIRARVGSENKRIERELDKSLDEMIKQFGGGATASAEAYALRAAANAEKRANVAEGTAEIKAILEKARAATWEGFGKSLMSQVDAVTKGSGKVTGAFGSGFKALGGAIAARVEQDSERRQKDADDKAKEAQRQRERFISGARGIYERLKDEQAAPLAMASGLQFGSQEEYASRVKHLLKGAVGGGDSEKELMKKAVVLQDEANKEDKRINAMFEEFYRGIKVAGPNN